MTMRMVLLVIWLRSLAASGASCDKLDAPESNAQGGCMIAKGVRQGLMIADAGAVPVPENWCSAAYTMPRVAICFHGAARSFHHQLVYETQKRNLVESLGADVTVFSHLTRKDARGDMTPENAGLFLEATSDQLSDAAARLGIEPGHMKVIEGPNADLPPCPNYFDGYSVRQEASKDEPHENTLGYLFSLAGQLSHREGCMDLIRKEEANTKKQFDTVILARADLTIYVPFKPFCMYNLTVPRRFRDWFFMVPRSFADEAFTKLHADFYQCRKPLALNVIVEDYESSIFEASQEDLSLPVLVTREDRADMPSICGSFTNPGCLPTDPQPDDLCGHMTFKNSFNHPVLSKSD